MIPEDRTALAPLLVLLKDLVEVFAIPYDEPEGYPEIEVLVHFTLAQARAAYPALHRLLLDDDPLDPSHPAPETVEEILDDPGGSS